MVKLCCISLCLVITSSQMLWKEPAFLSTLLFSCPLSFNQPYLINLLTNLTCNSIRPKIIIINQICLAYRSSEMEFTQASSVYCSWLPGLLPGIIWKERRKEGKKICEYLFCASIVSTLGKQRHKTWFVFKELVLGLHRQDIYPQKWFQHKKANH